jgi:hypothetical protein
MNTSMMPASVIAQISGEIVIFAVPSSAVGPAAGR